MARSKTIRAALIASIKRDVNALVRRDREGDTALSEAVFRRLENIEEALGWTRNRDEELTCRQFGQRIIAVAESCLVDETDLEDAAHTAAWVRCIDSYLDSRLGGEGVTWSRANEIADAALAKTGALANYTARHLKLNEEIEKEMAELRAQRAA